MRPSGFRSSSTASRSARGLPRSRSCPERCACVFRRSGILAAAYAALAVLVATGAVSGIDQWAIDHTMPDLGDAVTPTKLEAVVPLLRAKSDSAIAVVANVVTLPAQALIASLLVAACCAVLVRRGRARAAVVWGSAWVAANAVEVLCKALLERPLLHSHGKLLDSLQSSWPSGHTIRSVLLVVILATV